MSASAAPGGSSFDGTFGNPSWLVAHGLALVALAGSIVSFLCPHLDGLTAKAQSEVALLGPVVAAALVLGHRAVTTAEQTVELARHKITAAQWSADLAADVGALKVDVGFLADVGARLQTVEANVAAAPGVEALERVAREAGAAAGVSALADAAGRMAKVAADSATVVAAPVQPPAAAPAAAQVTPAAEAPAGGVAAA